MKFWVLHIFVIFGDWQETGDSKILLAESFKLSKYFCETKLISPN